MMNVYFLIVMCLINLLRTCYPNYHIATSAVLQCIMINRSRASELCHVGLAGASSAKPFSRCTCVLTTKNPPPSNTSTVCLIPISDSFCSFSIGESPRGG